MVRSYSELGIWESGTAIIGLDDRLYVCPMPYELNEMAIICDANVRVLCLCPEVCFYAVSRCSLTSL